MKLKIVIVDFEIPPPVKRWALRIGIPAVVLGVATLAYATNLPTFVTGEMLQASDLQTMSDAIAALQAQPQTPPGTIVAYGGAESGDGGVEEAPSGWLYCNGALVSRTTYANLFGAIAINFGGGDGVSTFALPDFRGQFLRGNDNGAGVDPGRTFGSTQADEFANHNHTLHDPGHTVPLNDGNGFMTQNASGTQVCAAAGGGWCIGLSSNSLAQTNIYIDAIGGAETRPKNVAVNYIIKY